jgi:hypothetical protein
MNKVKIGARYFAHSLRSKILENIVYWNEIELLYIKKGVSLKATHVEGMGSHEASQDLLNAAACVSATSVHTLAYAQGRLAFCALRGGNWPVAQWLP